MVFRSTDYDGPANRHLEIFNCNACIFRSIPVHELRIHDGMPCHPECRAINKAVKRTNKRLVQKKLVSESLEDDDPKSRKDMDNGDEKACDDEAEDEQRVKAKRNYNGRAKFEVIKKWITGERVTAEQVTSTGNSLN